MQFDARIEPVNAPKIASQIKDWALDEGFDRAGVARLTRSDHGPALADWLARGDHAEMTYLERRFETRIEPRTLFDGAASALCVAMQYHPLSGAEDPDGDLWARVARYARGRDYHQVMEERLKRLASRIEQAYPGTRTRVYVDTGPVLERELAARAGLGAIGKNTNLLDPEIGSWFLLGEIISSMHLEGDAVASDLCGTCTVCLEACPTGALPRAYRLDSRRCISYWTIEHRGAVPRQMRPLLGEWVFGCDICQEVCPVNTGVQAADHPEFELDTERATLDLAGLLSLDRDQYVQMFRGSPMKRAKLEGLQRNAAVAMGNSGATRYLPALKDALKSGGSLVRAHAAWALGQIGGTRARSALEDAHREETEEPILAEISAALLELSG
jgi:epoxyqueuosine reductase